MIRFGDSQDLVFSTALGLCICCGVHCSDIHGGGGPSAANMDGKGGFSASTMGVDCSAAGPGVGMDSSGAGSGSSGGGTAPPFGLAGGSGPSDASNAPDEGLALIDASGRTLPTCAKPTPPPNEVGGAQGSRPGECDYLLQSLDFEDKYSFASTPASIKVTNFGQALGLYQINNCSPYCYAKNLTVGVDITGGGGQAQLQGEIIVEFPATGPHLPITMADAIRNALAWVTFDGPSKPTFEIDTQLVVETSNGVVASAEVKPFFKANGLSPFGPFSVANDFSYRNGSEFKYFPFTQAKAGAGFPTAVSNVTGMGFRIVAKASAGQEWHGVAYIDHMHIRFDDAANNMPPGAYPFGL